MKFIILVFVLTSFAANAYELKFDAYDQEKLIQLIHRLPADIKIETTLQINSPTEGIKIKTEFPQIDFPVKIHCTGEYFHGSDFPSNSECRLTVDEHHPDVEMNYDEFKISTTDKDLVSALFETIPYGQPRKAFRSFGKSKGVNFEGRETYIFKYYFHCSERDCVMKISNILP